MVVALRKANQFFRGTRHCVMVQKTCFCSKDFTINTQYSSKLTCRKQTVDLKLFTGNNLGLFNYVLTQNYAQTTRNNNQRIEPFIGSHVFYTNLTVLLLPACRSVSIGMPCCITDVLSFLLTLLFIVVYFINKYL